MTRFSSFFGDKETNNDIDQVKKSNETDEKLHDQDSDTIFNLRKPEIHSLNSYQKLYGTDKNTFQKGLEILKSPLDIFSTFKNTFNLFKVVLITCVAGMILGVFLVFYGGYILSTKEVAAIGGEFWEGYINNEIKYFNPVLNTNSELEDRVIKLLYSPLYRVEYKDLFNGLAAPTLTPVLLSKNPEWKGKPGTTVSFSLKKDVKWSNNKSITVDDIEYTFKKLKEKNSNKQFNQYFQNLEFKAINTFDFEINTTGSEDLTLINRLNFYPINRAFYNDASVVGLTSDLNSIYATVTSGNYVLFDQVEDPFPINTDNINKDQKKLEDKRPNPIRNSKTGKFETIVLVKNKIKNNLGDSEKSYFEKYIITNFDSISEVKGTSQNSIANFKKNNPNKLNLISRDIVNINNLSGEDFRSAIGFKQGTVLTNQIYSLFLNMAQRGDGYLINSNLRKYIVCHLNNFTVKDSLKNLYENIGQTRKVAPIQLTSESAICPTEVADIDKILTDATDDSGNKIYTLKTDQERNQKQVYVFGREVSLNLLANINRSDPILNELRQYLLNIGLPTQEPIMEDDRVAANLDSQTKTYNLALIQSNLESESLYRLVGKDAFDLIQPTQNNRNPIPEYDFENNLKKWNATGDIEAKKKLVEFFKNENAMINLWQQKKELNFNDKSSLSVIDFNQVYGNNFLNTYLPKWYYKTVRE
jgi:hypothetical protein